MNMKVMRNALLVDAARTKWLKERGVYNSMREIVKQGYAVHNALRRKALKDQRESDMVEEEFLR